MRCKRHVRDMMVNRKVELLRRTVVKAIFIARIHSNGCRAARRDLFVAPQHIGKASGTFTTLRQLGGAFGVAIAVAVFAGAGSYASAQTFSDGFGPALLVCAGLALAGALAGTIPMRSRSASESPRDGGR